MYWLGVGKPLDRIWTCATDALAKLAAVVGAPALVGAYGGPDWTMCVEVMNPPVGTGVCVAVVLAPEEL